MVSKVKQARYTPMARLEYLVDLGFVREQIVLGLLDLDGCLFARLVGHDRIDGTKRSAPQETLDAPMARDELANQGISRLFVALIILSL